MKEVGLTPTYRVPEPNTWRQVLQTIDESVPVANQMVALQEYGKTNPSLIAGLEARGAGVLRVQVYRWDLPRRHAGRWSRTSATWPRDAWTCCCSRRPTRSSTCCGSPDDLGLTDRVRRRLAETVVASVGPTTSEMLRDDDLPVDIEPEHPEDGAVGRSRRPQQAATCWPASGGWPSTVSAMARRRAARSRRPPGTTARS